MRPPAYSAALFCRPDPKRNGPRSRHNAGPNIPPRAPHPEMDARTTAGSTVKYDCNPTCPSRKPYKSGPPVGAGIHAARTPCHYRQPYLPSPCRGRACPARNLPDTTARGHRTANPQHAPCPKIPLKICRKNQKQPLTTVIHIAIISKLSRGGHAAKSAS